MTLVLSELSSFGIAMAADSAITWIEALPDGDIRPRVVHGARKLQTIPKLDAGISIWGKGEINGINADTWLEAFISENEENYDSLDAFATLLESEIRDYIPQIDLQQNETGTIGFHLAGLIEYEGELTPTFYHIHNGISQALRRRGERVEDPTIINANHDCPPRMARDFFEGNRIYRTRNGDIQIYNRVFGLLEQFLLNLARERHIIIPHSISISDRVNWLKFQIETMSELYEFSNLPIRGIGGNIATLTISSEGELDYNPS